MRTETKTGSRYVTVLPYPPRRRPHTRHTAESGEQRAPCNYAGSLAGTPVFLGCSDVDPHIPKERVHHTAEVLRQLGAEVSLRLYRNMDHAVNHDEIKFVRDMLARLMRESWSLRFMTRLCAIRVLSGDIE